MKLVPSPKQQSRYIARWRLYLWYLFLQDGDETRFIIAEDRIMARKAKNKLHRMEVMRHLHSIIHGTPDTHPFENTNLLELTTTLISTAFQKKTILATLNTKMKTSYQAVITPLNHAEPVISYSSVTHKNEMRVKTNNNVPPFTGRDLLKFFNKKGGTIVYNGRAVIAVKGEDRCSLYFKGEKNERIPIKGADAKIIGAAILADLAKQHLENNDSEEICLVQGYKINGQKDEIAEYYSNSLKNNSSHQDKEILSQKNMLIKSIIAPLNELIEDFQSAGFPIYQRQGQDQVHYMQQIHVIIETIKKELALDKNIEKNAEAYSRRVTQYSHAIRGMYSDIYNPSHYQALPHSNPKLIRRFMNINADILPESLARVHNLLDCIFQERYLIYQSQNPNNHEPLINDNLYEINQYIAEFNQHINNEIITIQLYDDNFHELINGRMKSIPTYFKIARSENKPFVFLTTKAQERQELSDKMNNKSTTRYNYQCLRIESSRDESNDPNSKDMLTPIGHIESGNLAVDLVGASTEILPSFNNSQSSSSAHEYILGSLVRDSNTAEDVGIIIDNILNHISPRIPPSVHDASINRLTLKKLAYTILQGVAFQGSFQLSNIGQILSAGDPMGGVSTSPGSSISKFLRVDINKKGDAVITFITLVRPFATYDCQRSYLHESCAIKTVITVNILDKDPEFRMKQKAEFKEVPELKPEYFFNKAPANKNTPRFER